MLAALLAAAVVVALRRRGPEPAGGLLFFFVLLLLGVWAGGAWLRAVGPPLAGVYWAGFVVVGLALALILAAASPSRGDVGVAPPERGGATKAVALTLGVFFYLAAFVLAAAIVVRLFG